MAADILVLTPGPTRLRAEQADKVRQALLPFEDELPELVDELLYRVDRLAPTRQRWTFVMLSPDQNAAVVQHMLKASKRPLQFMALWSYCFCHLDLRTGEIRKARDELARDLDIPSGSISEIMGELKAFGAISTRRVRIDGMRGLGAVRYFMNPNVATHLAGKARDLAQDRLPMVAVQEARLQFLFTHRAVTR